MYKTLKMFLNRLSTSEALSLILNNCFVWIYNIIIIDNNNIFVYTDFQNFGKITRNIFNSLKLATKLPLFQILRFGFLNINLRKQNKHLLTVQNII